MRDAARAAGIGEPQRFAFRRLVEQLSREDGEDLNYADLLTLAFEFVEKRR